ncbi:MAG: hypothetical protein ACREDD_13785 [Methylocella sp.]
MPDDGATWLKLLYTALKVLDEMIAPLERRGDDRLRFIAYDAARQKASEARAAVDAIFFPLGRGELPDRRDVDSRCAASMDTLAAAEHALARLEAECAPHEAVDEAETMVRHAARSVEREIVAAAALDEKEAAARKAAGRDAWDRFWPPYLALQTELASHLHAVLGLAKKIRRVNDYVHKTGVCPASECLPYPTEFVVAPAAIEQYLKDLERAIWWHNQLLAKRSAA